MMGDTAFGLDLAGYSTGKSGLVRAQKRDNNYINLTVFSSHALSEKCNGNKRLCSIQNKEVELIRDILKQGSLIVDVPIDLQGLPFMDSPIFIWQLTKRAVDQAFNGFPPFADRMGSYVARFNQILKRVISNNPGLVGTKVFETYPAATLDLTKLLPKGNKDGYKGGRAVFDGERWVHESSKKDDLAKCCSIAKLANRMNITADSNTKIDDDIFDAAICALTGIAPTECKLVSSNLEKVVKERLGKAVTDKIDIEMPAGYVLLNKIEQVSTIHLTVADNIESFTGVA